MKLHRDKIDLLSSLMLTGFCLFLFRDIIFGGHHLGGIDFVQFYLAMKKFLYEEIHIHRSIPFWNPYIFSGMPFWAHFESTIFYPLGFLFWVLPPNTAYDLTMFAHTALAGVFMYFMARAFGIGRTGSFVSAAVYGCNGFLMANIYLGQLSPVMSYIWLPLAITFLHRATQSPAPWGSAMIAGGLWGIQILAGAPQDAFYTFLASALSLLCTLRRGKAMKPSVVRLLSIALLVFVVGAGLSCIQTIPAFELISQSVRASLDTYDMATLASYPLQGIITILMPHFFGNYADSSLWVSNTPWSIPQQNLYVGLLPLVLLGFVSLQVRVDKRVIVFGGLLAVVALILAFGHHTPIYKIVYLLPGFDRFRAPSKIMVLWVFSMALLAGIGLDGLLSYLKKGAGCRLHLLSFFVLLLIALILIFRYHPPLLLKIFSPFVLADAIPAKMPDAARIISAELQRLTLLSSLVLLLFLLLRRGVVPLRIGASALCALLLVDLGYVHGRAVRHDDSTYQRIAEIQRNILASLTKDKSLYRVGAFQHSLGANLEMVLGYQSVNGFTALFPSRYYDYMMRYSDNKLPAAWVSLFFGVTKHHVFMDLLNVKYEILYADKAIGFRETYLPRAFIVPDHRVARPQEVLDILTSSDFDPRKTVVFEEEDGDALREPVTQEPSPSEKVEIKTYRPDTIILNTSSQNSGYLFLSEIHYPGWKAFLDDQPTTILRGNYLFRVIPLPAGHHHVRLVFDPLTIKLGIGVSIGTLLVILSTLFGFFWRKRIQAKR